MAGDIVFWLLKCRVASVVVGVHMGGVAPMFVPVVISSIVSNVSVTDDCSVVLVVVVGVGIIIVSSCVFTAVFDGVAV